MEFEGKKIIVTGGSSGIGKAMSQKFIEEGGIVKVLDIKKPDYDVSYSIVDISNDSSVKDFFSRLNSLDVLVNNAGVFKPSQVHVMSESELDEILNVNLKGPFIVSKYAIPLLRKNGGNIINISSGLGLRANKDAHAYCATKAALIMLTQCMAHAYAPNIRVNAVLPGSTDTPLLRKYADLSKEKELNPMKKIASPEEVAEVVAFLASEKASFVTGASWAIDGGESSSSMYT